MAGFERAVKSDLTDRYEYVFKGGGTSHNLMLQNTSPDTVIYLKFGRHSTAPSASDCDLALPAAMSAPMEIADISVQIITTSYTDSLAIWRYPRIVS